MSLDVPTTPNPARTSEACPRSDRSENVEARPTRSSAVDEATNLANPANVPVEMRRDTASPLLPSCEITEPANSPRSTENRTADQYAKELREALTRTDLLGRARPDSERVRTIMNAIGGAEAQAVEAAYKNLPSNNRQTSLRDDLNLLPPADRVKLQAILNRNGENTNDAGHLMVALTSLAGNRADGERRVIETFATLNGDSMSTLEKDFQKHYNMSVTEALNLYGVSRDARSIIDVLRTPIDQRTADDLKGLAEYALSKKSLDFLSIALRGDTPQAIEARQSLSQDPEFLSRLIDTFRGERSSAATLSKLAIFSAGPGMFTGIELLKTLSARKEDATLSVAFDIVRDGRPSLATIAHNNTGSLFGITDNVKNINTAVEGANDTERSNYALGRELATARKAPTNEQEANALAFYTRTKAAFDLIGDKRQVALLEAKLLFGKDSFAARVLSGENTNARFGGLEGMSKQDWQLISDKDGGAKVREQIISLLQQVDNPADVSRFRQLLNQKAEAGSFEDSQKVRRTLLEAIRQGTDSGWFSTSYDTHGITQAITNISEADAHKYSTDPAFRNIIDTFVQQNLDAPTQLYLRSILSQVEATGKPAQIGPLQKVLANSMNNVESRDALVDIEKLLKADPALRQRLGERGADLTAQERAIKDIIAAVANQALFGTLGTQFRNGREVASPERDAAFRSLWENGRLPLALKAQLNMKGENFYQEATNATTEERAALINSNYISNDERKLVEAIAAQGGTARLEDRIRAALLTDGADLSVFKRELRMLAPEARQQLRDVYVAKFGRTMESDLLSNADQKDRPDFSRLLGASNADGRQEFYDNLESFLYSRSGYSPDGSPITLDRAINNQAALLQEFSNRFEKLPQEVRDRANQLFREALQDYRESKEQFAEKLYQAAILVGGVGVSVITGGLALPTLAAFAAMSAAGRIALKSTIQGNDYELNLGNILRDGAVGAFNGGFAVLGPETIMAFRGIGALTARSMMARVYPAMLKDGVEGIIAREVNTLAGQSLMTGQPVTRAALETLAGRVSRPDANLAAVADALNASITQAGVKITEAVLLPRSASALGTIREISGIGAFGGVTNVLSDVTVGAVNGKLDLSGVPADFAVGLLAGGAFAGLLKAGSAGIANLRRGESNFYSYEPEVFKPSITNVRISGNSDEVAVRSVKVSQSLDENGLVDLTVRANSRSGMLSGSFVHNIPGASVRHTKLPQEDLIRGLEVRVNGETVTLTVKSTSAGSRGTESMEWSAPVNGDKVSIEYFFYGRQIGRYSYDSFSNEMTRLEPPRHLSAFDIRSFHVRPGFGQQWAREGKLINPRELPANQVDLHTHFGGAMSASTVIAVAKQFETPYPVKFLKNAGVHYYRSGVEIINGEQFVRIKAENFPATGGLDKLEKALRIPEDARTSFTGMERVYKLRGPLVKDVNAFPVYLEHIARDYANQGVHYAELSISDILKPEFLEKAKSILPEIERQTGVKLRFVVGIWRHSTDEEIAQMVTRTMQHKNEKYIVGVDFMGEEKNATLRFAPYIKQLAEFRKERPEFQIRIHAGESKHNLQNVKDAIRFGATRIGHGLRGIDDEAIQLAIKHGVVMEHEINSNLALGYILDANAVPVKRYLDAGVRVSIGTDGYGTYQSSARSEQSVFMSLGLTPADFAKITASDRRYLRDMEVAEARIAARTRSILPPLELVH